MREISDGKISLSQLPKRTIPPLLWFLLVSCCLVGTSEKWDWKDGTLQGFSFTFRKHSKSVSWHSEPSLPMLPLTQAQTHATQHTPHREHTHIQTHACTHKHMPRTHTHSNTCVHTQTHTTYKYTTSTSSNPLGFL